MNVSQASSAPTGSNSSSPATDEPISFTHNGHEYTATHEADGGVTVSRDDGITKYFNAEQAGDLRGLPTQDVLFGAPQDIPDASFQGTPLGQLFDPTPSAPEPLW